MAFSSVVTANSLATFGLTLRTLHVVCNAEAATCTKISQRKETLLPHQHAVTAGGGGRESTYRQLSEIQTRQGRAAKKKTERTTTTTTWRVCSSNLITPSVSFTAALRDSAEQQQRLRRSMIQWVVHPQQKKNVPAPALQQESCQSVRTPLVRTSNSVTTLQCSDLYSKLWHSSMVLYRRRAK
jgi:hypothetical protein